MARNQSVIVVATIAPLPGLTLPRRECLDAAPDLFTALQQQLGLKVESTEGLVEVLVVDRVEKPSAN